MRTLARPAVFLAGLAPALWLGARAYAGRLSVNPIEDLTLTTGIWALRFLVLTLAITPIRRLTGWNRPKRGPYRTRGDRGRHEGHHG